MSIHVYPFLVGIACGISFFYFNSYSKNKFSKNLLFLFLVLTSSFLGAKLLFLLTLPKHIKFSISSVSFLNSGGYVFYGGLILGIISFYFFTKLNKNFSKKFIIPALCLGHGIGRLACYQAGCCYGLNYKGIVLPVQLLEASILFLMFLFFHNRKNKNFFYQSKQYLLIYSSVRFLLEFLRDDQLRGFYFGLSTSQIISICILFGLAIEKTLNKKSSLN